MPYVYDTDESELVETTDEESTEWSSEWNDGENSVSSDSATLMSGTDSDEEMECSSESGDEDEEMDYSSESEDEEEDEEEDYRQWFEAEALEKFKPGERVIVCVSKVLLPTSRPVLARGKIQDYTKPGTSFRLRLVDGVHTKFPVKFTYDGRNATSWLFPSQIRSRERRE